MEQKKVSIIVPLYNAEKFAHKCVDSILSQNFQDFECILIDDGSKDNTGAICDEYASNNSSIIVLHKKNGGVSSARNLGLEKATGEWITFVDADDWIEPDFLSIMNSQKCQDVDWIFSEWKTIWDDGKSTITNLLDEPYIYQSSEAIRYVWNNNAHRDVFRCPWGKFFRRTIIKDNNLQFNLNLRYAEDTLFNYEYLTKVKGILFNKEKNSNYIFNQNSQTVAITKYKCTPESLIIARDRILDIYYSLGFDNPNFERLFFFEYTMMEHCFLGKEDKQIRKDYYKGSIQKKLEEKCLSTIRIYDKWMYIAYKKIPHKLLAPLSNIYLKFR